MQDFDELKKIKAQCISDIRDALPLYANRLNSIDERLMIYIEDAISNEGSHSNLYENLGIRKELRLMSSYDLDPERVKRSLRAIEGQWANGRHVKGGLKFDTPRGNMHVRLMPYQVWCLFGIYTFKVDVCMERRYTDGEELLPTEWVGKDGMVWDTRRLTEECHLFQTRKSGKTEFGAALDFTEACFLGPANAQVFICSPSAKISKTAYKAVKEFATQVDPTCLNRMGGKYFRLTADSMNWQPGHRMKGEIMCMAAGKTPKDSFYAYIVHADEHGQPGYINGKCDMQSAVETLWGSTGPRRERLLIHTTTAGLNMEGPYRNQLRTVEQSLLNELNFPLGESHRTPDDKWFAFLLQLDPWEQGYELDQLDNTELFKKVNRSIGITVQPTYYSGRIYDARKSDDTRKEVLTKDFNIWQGVSIKDWIKAEQVRPLQREMRIDDCTKDKGWVIFGGLDFSQGDDLHTGGWLAARKHPSGRGTEFFADFDAWIKESTMKQSSIRPLYEQWITQGWLHVSPGEIFQPSLFINRLDELIRKGCQFMYFGYDKYQSKDPINTLKAYLQSAWGIANPDPYIQVVSQLNSEFNAPTDDLFAAMFAPVPFISFSNNPMWPWCFGNAALEIDGRDNKRPVKRSQSDSCKVDPVQALIMALDLYERYEGTLH